MPSIIEVFGNCRVVEQVASGPLTDVYHAIQEPLGRHVAVKALRATIAPSSPFALHLAREAELLAKLHHDNILELYDFVRTDSAMWLVLEFVDGVSLAEVLAKSERLGVHGALAVGVEVAKALAHAHDRGIIHRDIKPANGLLSRPCEIKLVEFGVERGRAKVTSEPPAAHRRSWQQSLVIDPSRAPLWPAVRGFLGLLLLAVAGGVAIQMEAGKAEADASGKKGPLELVPVRAGFLRVVARPWAEVVVDGQRIDVTPFARPIPLSSGTHYVTLKHPKANDERRVVKVSPGETVMLEVTMNVKGMSPADAGADRRAPPEATETPDA